MLSRAHYDCVGSELGIMSCWNMLLNRRVTLFESRVVQNGDAERFNQFSWKVGFKILKFKHCIENTYEVKNSRRHCMANIWDSGPRAQDFSDFVKKLGDQWTRTFSRNNDMAQPRTRTIWINISLYFGDLDPKKIVWCPGGHPSQNSKPRIRFYVAWQWRHDDLQTWPWVATSYVSFLMFHNDPCMLFNNDYVPDKTGQVRCDLCCRSIPTDRTS